MSPPPDNKPDFFRALRPEPVRVLGVDLLPFSLGHAAHLIRFGCYPITDPADLLLALVICSTRFEDLPGVIGGRWFRLRMRIWGWTHGWIIRRRFTQKMQLFNSYITAGSVGPEIFERDDDGEARLPGAPWLAHLKTVLQSELGYSRSDALNAPYGEALWDYYTHWENKQKVEIIDDESVTAIQRQADENHEWLVKMVGRN